MTAPATVARVLVAMDFDDASATALRMAALLARAWQAEVTVFHAETEDVPAYFTAKQFDALENEQLQHRAALADHLRAFAAPHAGAVQVVIGGVPVPDSILRIAPQFDLIALGTHQRHGAQRWWLGSVAESVVRQATRPVLVVPASAPVPSGGSAPNILLVGGGSPTAEQWADAVRTAFGGRVMHAASIDDCTRDRLREADLIVFALPADAGHAQVAAVTHMLKECLHPVLFVPSSEDRSKGARHDR